jgi:hypothetical protein
MMPNAVNSAENSDGPEGDPVGVDGAIGLPRAGRGAGLSTWRYAWVVLRDRRLTSYTHPLPWRHTKAMPIRPSEPIPAVSGGTISCIQKEEKHVDNLGDR